MRRIKIIEIDVCNIIKNGILQIEICKILIQCEKYYWDSNENWHDGWNDTWYDRWNDMIN